MENNQSIDLSLNAMRSAYHAFLGKEPEFTNFAKVLDDEPFIDTLDYLFLSPQWTVADVLPLPALADANLAGPMPTKDEPSDHLMIAAQLMLN